MEIIMKKLIAVALATLMILTVLSGCQQFKLFDDDYDDYDDYEEDDDRGGSKDSSSPKKPSVVGTEAAKLLLAQERLDSQLLKNDGDIFENGSEVFRNLASIAKDNLVKYTYEGNGDQIMNLSFKTGSTVPLSSTVKSTDGSKLEIDGDLYKWSDFAEYSNSYDYFTNLTGCVVSSANAAAQLIDSTKRYVRVTDKWVDVGGVHYYLHVEDNCEILYERFEDMIRICRRTKNDQGVNVYELANITDDSNMRMTYIQGQKYEYTYATDGGFNHNFIAENTKGFWEVVDVGRAETHFNVSCMVVKDDICYDAFYNPDEEFRGLSMLKVISADKKTDIMFFSGDGSSIELQLQGFDGIECIQIEVPEENVDPVTNHVDTSYLLYLDQDGQRYYQTTGSRTAEVVLKNGMVLREHDSYLDGRVTVGRTLVSFFNKEGGTCGYAPSLYLMVQGESYEERMETLGEFLALTGLTCRRDMDYVQAGITQAYTELEQFVQHHQWNESPITTNEDLARGFDNLDAKYSAWRKMYEAIKDEEVIDINDTETVEFNIKFAPITEQKAEAVTNDGLTVSVNELSLTIEDTLLLVENDPYMINFALRGRGGLVHIEVSGTRTVAYTGESKFSVSQNATFEIPALSPDEYTVVAYISTTDGIRVSGYTELVFTEVSVLEAQNGNVAVKTSKGSGGELLIKCEEILDVEVEVKFEATDVYKADMYSALSEAAYQYGYAATGADVEVLSADGAWTAVVDDGSALTGGTYRLKYEIKNGASLVEGYVLTQYSK